MNNRIRFMYVRDNKMEPVGCLAIRVNRSKNRAEFGLSTLHPKDGVDSKGRRLKFDRVKSQSLASIRLSEDPTRVYIHSEATQHEITRAVMQAMIAADAPTRAKKFAKQWLAYTEVVFAKNNAWEDDNNWIIKDESKQPYPLHNADYDLEDDSDIPF
jgi:hypothetical protein